MAGVSIHDPSAARPGRVIFAVLVFLASVAAAVTAGAIGAVPSQDEGSHAVALFIGDAGAIGLLIATGFALPFRWRTSDRAGLLLLGQGGLLLVAGSAGMAVARTSLPAPRSVMPPSVIAAAGLGVALMLAAPALRARSRRRAALRDEMIGSGRQATGLVTSVTQTGTVNQVPRWRVAVQFQDATGTTRWVTKHTTTWQPPVAGQQAAVYFDPVRPGDQRRIVVAW
jgi:hypothetical protein